MSCNNCEYIHNDTKGQIRVAINDAFCEMEAFMMGARKGEETIDDVSRAWSKLRRKLQENLA